MAGRERDGLKLLAEGPDDLQVMSAALQDAVVRVGDLELDPTRRTFTAAMNRFRWETRRRGPGERVRAALQIAGVTGARRKGLAVDRPDAVASLLSLGFEPDGEPPAGVVRLVFAGGGEIALDVECLDAALADVSPAWPARSRPRHEDS